MFFKLLRLVADSRRRIGKVKVPVFDKHGAPKLNHHEPSSNCCGTRGNDRANANLKELPMASGNDMFLDGNLGADPETRNRSRHVSSYST